MEKKINDLTAGDEIWIIDIVNKYMPRVQKMFIYKVQSDALRVTYSISEKIGEREHTHISIDHQYREKLGNSDTYERYNIYYTTSINSCSKAIAKLVARALDVLELEKSNIQAKIDEMRRENWEYLQGLWKYPIPIKRN